jgi:hypothetical protein
MLDWAVGGRIRKCLLSSKLSGMQPLPRGVEAA